jgi:hypothetical protein
MPTRTLSDYPGLRFGRLIVVRYIRRVNNTHLWICLCDCGKEFKARQCHFSSGRTIECQSCGYARTAQKKTVHGHTSHGGPFSPTYRSWSMMRVRCTNRKRKEWKDYGGRGIKVCRRWIDFRNFLADMGERPSLALTLDRIDNDGNYEPGNCRWATRIEQARNSRPRSIVKHGL